MKRINRKWEMEFELCQWCNWAYTEGVLWRLSHQRELLRDRVSALTDQRKRLQITDVQYVTQLQALGIPPKYVNALQAAADALISPKTKMMVSKAWNRIRILIASLILASILLGISLVEVWRQFS